MRALDHTQEGYQERKAHNSIITSLVNRFSKLSEAIWLTITFLLFIVMGPFSVIAVLYGLWALGTGETKKRIIEPASCQI